MLLDPAVGTETFLLGASEKALEIVAPEGTAAQRRLIREHLLHSFYGFELVGAENPVTSCDLHVLVYEAAEPVSSQWPNCRFAAWGSAARRRLLSE